MPNNINLYFIINKGQIVFGYILFDLVLFDIRYCQQISDKEMLIGNVKEETEEKIDIENDSSYLTAC